MKRFFCLFLFYFIIACQSEYNINNPADTNIKNSNPESHILRKFYVSNEGNDLVTEYEAQNPSTPWKTIDKINSFNLQPGDAVLFKRGDIFYGQLKIINKSGTNSNNIYIGAYGTGKTPVINGIKYLNNWTLYKNNIYQTLCDNSINKLFLNEKNLKCSRYPSVDYAIISSVSDRRNFSSENLAGLPDLTGASIHIKTERWSLDARTIENHNSTLIRLNRDTNYQMKEGWGFFINNHLNLITNPGEWAYDSMEKKIYFYPENGENPDNIKISYSHYDYGIYLSNCNYITINELEFFGQNHSAIKANKSSNLLFYNLKISQTSNCGIDIDVNNTIVSGAIINNCSVFGIKLKGNYNKIENSIITDIGILEELGPNGLGGNCCSGRGIDINGNNNTITNNQIKNIGYIGIGFLGENTLIEKNIIEGCCKTLDDGGAIYTWSDDYNKPGSYGSIISSNIIINIYGTISGVGREPKKTWANGIYLDDRTHHIKVLNNSIRNADVGIFLHNTRDNEIKNNTIFDAREGGIILQRDSITGSDEMFGNVINNNIYLTRKDHISGYSERIYTDNSKPPGVFNSNYFAKDNKYFITITKDKEKIYNKCIIKDLFDNNGELVVNDNFNNLNKWNSWPSGGITLSNENYDTNNVLKAIVKQLPDYNNLLLIGPSFSISSDFVYYISFKIKTENFDSIKSNIRQNYSPWKAYNSFYDINIYSNWQTIDFIYEPAFNILDNNARFEIEIPGKDGVFYIDDFLIKRLNNKNITLSYKSWFLYNNGKEICGEFPDIYPVRDLSGNIYNGSINLSPFQSIILVY